MNYSRRLIAQLLEHKTLVSPHPGHLIQGDQPTFPEDAAGRIAYPLAESRQTTAVENEESTIKVWIGCGGESVTYSRTVVRVDDSLTQSATR